MLFHFNLIVAVRAHVKVIFLPLSNVHQYGFFLFLEHVVAQLLILTLQ